MLELNRNGFDLEKIPDGCLLLDGFHDAIVDCDLNANQVVYSLEKIIEVLMENGNEYHEAIEFFYFNIEPVSYIHGGAQILDDLPSDEDYESDDNNSE